ncbi:unnamed protein product [Cyprideis torosa]|uniref:Uncharacterized protein n=1 Tax=Cyprideis torosa TaxID=163714 RepID=A0A7R8ZH94_9CRUS|nr:unnamed protein product [Cyprideis torosa]CAG0883148.1 unnamed protein product [Cyprideis torosa]
MTSRVALNRRSRGQTSIPSEISRSSANKRSFDLRPASASPLATSSEESFDDEDSECELFYLKSQATQTDPVASDTSFDR